MGKLKQGIVVAAVLVVAAMALGLGRADEPLDLEGALVVDVRTPGEYRRGHFPGAMNIPVSDLTRRMSELEPRDRALVLYCRSGNRSASARASLLAAGFIDVTDAGGLSELRRRAN